MKATMDYNDLEKHYTQPKGVTSPFSSHGRIPRKLKKKVKDFCGGVWSVLENNGQKLWYYLEVHNPNYKRFLIKQIAK